MRRRKPLGSSGAMFRSVCSGARHKRFDNQSETNVRKITDTTHAHGLHQHLNKIVSALEHPIAVLANFSEDATENSVVVVVDVNVDSRKVIVPVKVEAESSGDGKRINSHLVLTIFDKNNWIDNTVKPAVDAEARGEIGVFYVDANKAAKYSVFGALMKNYQHKEGIFDSFIHNIHEDGSPVKGVFKDQTETLQAYCLEIKILSGTSQIPLTM